MAQTEYRRSLAGDARLAGKSLIRLRLSSPS
jgi:hypothetical protein